MILSQQGTRIIQPQPKWIKIGLYLQKIPILKDLVTRGAIMSCSSIQNSSNSSKWISKFAKSYKIPFKGIERCQNCATKEECWGLFDSFNDFFIRRRIGLPSVSSPARGLIVSPVDAYTILLEENYSHIWIKGSQFSINRLFTGNETDDNHYPDILDLKKLFVFRLAPHHYHRFHAPVHGWIRKMYVLGSKKYSVDPILIQSSARNVLTENVRIIIAIELKDVFPTSYIYIAIIGATCVGSIIITHPKILNALSLSTALNDRHLNRMRTPRGRLGVRFTREENVLICPHEELGYFEYGGSTVCMAISKRRFKNLSSLSRQLLHNTKRLIETEINVGDPLCLFKLN